MARVGAEEVRIRFLGEEDEDFRPLEGRYLPRYRGRDSRTITKSWSERQLDAKIEEHILASKIEDQKEHRARIENEQQKNRKYYISVMRWGGILGIGLYILLVTWIISLQ